VTPCSRCGQMSEHTQGVLNRCTGKIDELCPSCYSETANIEAPITELEVKLIKQNRIKPQVIRRTNVMRKMRGLE